MVSSADDSYERLKNKIFDKTLGYIKSKVEVIEEDKDSSRLIFTTETIHELSRSFGYDQDIVRWWIELDPHHSNLKYPCFSLYYETYNMELREYLHKFITKFYDIKCDTRKIDSEEAYIYSKWMDKSDVLNGQTAQNIINTMVFVCMMDVKRIDGHIKDFMKRRNFEELKKESPQLFSQTG